MSTLRFNLIVSGILWLAMDVACSSKPLEHAVPSAALGLALVIAGACSHQEER